MNPTQPVVIHDRHCVGLLPASHIAAGNTMRYAHESPKALGLGKWSHLSQKTVMDTNQMLQMTTYHHVYALEKRTKQRSLILPQRMSVVST
uniref:Uncharacterized protein n=1 Tax=Oryza meridionalis TaxID=40149 RepID=A0A0E0D0E1_9ORYZ